MNNDDPTAAGPPQGNPERPPDLPVPPPVPEVRAQESGQRPQTGGWTGPEKPRHRPAEFPRGLWRSIDYMLHHPGEILESLRTDTNLGKLSITFAVISVVMAAIYGAVMGSTNLLQGSQMAMPYKLLMIAVTAVKVPVLFFLTLLIVLPPVYVSNTFLGGRVSFRQMLAVLLAATAITVTVLTSMATVAFFFALTSRSYQFLKLLHVAFFVYAGLTGIAYLMKTMEDISGSEVRSRSNGIFVLWLLLYMFVGAQLAWVLRPFVSSPNEPFQVFRPRSGNFYEAVLHGLQKPR